MTGGLTPRLAECLAFIRQYIGEHDGVSPSLDEIAAALALSSKSTVQRMLVGLAERGFITWTPSRSRSLQIVPTVVDFTTWLEGLSAEEFANAEAVMKDVGFRRRRDRTLGLSEVRV